MQQHTERITHDELAAAQAAFDAENMSAWRVGIIGATMDDHREYFTASRPISNGQTEVAHSSASVLLQLAKATDARLGLSKPVAVSEGQASSVSH